jgi:hypothetical protein
MSEHMLTRDVELPHLALIVPIVSRGGIVAWTSLRQRGRLATALIDTRLEVL